MATASCAFAAVEFVSRRHLEVRPTPFAASTVLLLSFSLFSRWYC
jgi:hypothetical protein